MPDRQRIPGRDPRHGSCALIALNAALDFVLGLAFVPGQFDAVDAAVADVDEVEIVDEAAEEAGAAGGVRTDAIALQRKILFIGACTRSASAAKAAVTPASETDRLAEQLSVDRLEIDYE